MIMKHRKRSRGVLRDVFAEASGKVVIIFALEKLGYYNQIRAKKKSLGLGNLKNITQINQH